jgi:hypothetical protein
LKKERDKRELRPNAKGNALAGRMKGEGHGAWEKVTGQGVRVGDEGGRR